MNHYYALPEFPNYDRTKDPYMKKFLRDHASRDAIITLTGDPITTGHLAKVQHMRAVRLNRHGQWRNAPTKKEIVRHNKFGAKSCADCDSGVYCRCPIHANLVNEITDATSPYSREGQPASPAYVAFREAAQKMFSPQAVARPGSAPPLPTGSSLLQTHPHVALRAPFMPPYLGDAVLSAGYRAARRHVARESMCGGGLHTTKAALRPRRPKSAAVQAGKTPWDVDYPPTPRTQDDADPHPHPGLKMPSPFRRCI